MELMINATLTSVLLADVTEPRPSSPRHTMRIMLSCPIQYYMSECAARARKLDLV